MEQFAHHYDFVLIFYNSGYRAKLVDIALETGKIYDGEGFNYIKESFENGTLHLIGLLSDGGVHSRLDQLQVYIFSYEAMTLYVFSFSALIFS